MSEPEEKASYICTYTALYSLVCMHACVHVCNVSMLALKIQLDGLRNTLNPEQHSTQQSAVSTYIELVGGTLVRSRSFHSVIYPIRHKLLDPFGHHK